MNKKIDLLKYVYKFYPVGISQLNRRQYPGYLEMEKISKMKCESVESGTNTEWTSLIAGLRDMSLDVFDQGLSMFPSYKGWLDLGSQQKDGYNFLCRLHFCISLLCPHYTIFFEDRYVFSDFECSIPPSSTIFYSRKANNTGSQQQIWLAVDELIRGHFPGHTFIEHKLLFDYRIHSVSPFESEPDTASENHGLYQLLFDGHQVIDTLQILK